jgi:NaMN:DMB phosphoribosyltransferase
VAATGPEIRPGMRLPAPDESAATGALARLTGLDIAGAGFGELARAVAFAAGAQASADPRPWRCPYVLVLPGDHAGGAAAGAIPGESGRRAALARDGAGPLGILAARAGATLRVVEAPPARPMELGPALEAGEVDDAMRRGWLLAEEAIGAGADVLVIGSCGTGTDAAAAAVLAATAGAEVAAVLPRAIAPGARIDDDAWMVRCAAARDALYRIRHTARGAHEGMAGHSLSRLVNRRRNPRGAHYVLAELGGGDMAIATGVVLGAAARRTPVLVDGPVGVVAVLASRDLAGQARHWCLLADHGQNPTVTFAARVLELSPLTDLRLDLGEGATALAMLPLLGTALELAATLPAHPAAPTEPAAHTEPTAPPAHTEPTEPAAPAAPEPPATGGAVDAG